MFTTVNRGCRTDGTSRETYLVAFPHPPEERQTQVALPITSG